MDTESIKFQSKFHCVSIRVCMYVHAQNKSILKHAYLRLAKTDNSLCYVLINM